MARSRLNLARILVLCTVTLVFSGGFSRLCAQNPPPPMREPALWLRPVKLHSVWNHILDLFRETPFDSPAEALAAAKVAGIQPAGGNKTVEAIVSIFNRAIVPDLAPFDRSLFALEPNAPMRRIDWRAGVAPDDGTAEALVTALALDRSQPAGQVAGFELESLGDNVSVARGNGQTWFGPDRTALETGLRSGADARLISLAPPIDSGFWIRADPRQWPSTVGRNVQEFVTLETLRRFAAGRPVEVRFFPWGESVQAEWIDLFRAMPVSPVQSRWLARWDIPLNGLLMAQASLGLDPRKPFWGQVFGIATEVERAIPGREKVANVRDRINIASLLARVSPETDLYPNLIGVTVGAVVPDAPELPPTVVATLHTRDVRATQIVVEKFLVPVIRTIGGDPKGKPPAALAGRGGDDRIRGLAIVSNRPIFLFLEPPDIHIVWGTRNVAEAALAAADRAATASTMPLLWFDRFAASGPVHRAAAVYPEAVVRWQILKGEPDSLWTQSAKGLPPMVWLGRSENGDSRDIWAFSGARAYVKSMTSKIPPAKDRTAANENAAR